ncbi:PaaX family transcriptional regulator C-terminal domain-containing protein [Nioella aestuarii]
MTIFGDLARREGEGISGAVLTRLVGLMGIKPEATRVALFRLRKDGWIDSVREGRGSLHCLTQLGRRQSAEASPRIYDAERQFPEYWHLLVSGSGEQTGRGQLDSLLLTGDYLPVGAQAVIGPGRLPDDLKGLLGVEADRFFIPGWLHDQICPPELMAQYLALENDLRAVLERLHNAPLVSVEEAAALRLLIVHSWRRLLFRHSDLPDWFFPEGWPGPTCRSQFRTLMDLLPVPELSSLEELR